jgi:hypothetical protein
LRLPAELIRDQALAVSGMLVQQLGGPSVKPYQPEGLWEELASGVHLPGQFYEQDHGANLYRRSLYTFWKRTVPPASLATFDAPNREMCTTSRSRTNTPLQAMVLMNDPSYVEAARGLGQWMMTEGGATAQQRIGAAFRRALGRPPRPEELKVLRSGFEDALNAYRQDDTAARRLIHVGESPCPAKLDRAELAAFTTVASVILNLDETITKE